jgi:hypothetical protein
MTSWCGRGRFQRRLRALPSRVGVYFVLALGLFPERGYARVWAELTAELDGLDGLTVAAPSEKALRDLRAGWARRRSRRCSRCWPGRWPGRTRPGSGSPGCGPGV